MIEGKIKLNCTHSNQYLSLMFPCVFTSRLFLFCKHRHLHFRSIFCWKLCNNCSSHFFSTHTDMHSFQGWCFRPRRLCSSYACTFAVIGSIYQICGTCPGHHPVPPLQMWGNHQAYMKCLLYFVTSKPNKMAHLKFSMTHSIVQGLLRDLLQKIHLLSILQFPVESSALRHIFCD